LILQTYGDFHVLIKDSEDELQDINDEEIYEVNSPFLHISPEPSTKASENPKKSKKRRVERSQPNPPKASKKPKQSDSESSSGSLDFKAIDNNAVVEEYAEEYAEENADHKTHTDTSMSNTMDLIDKINKSRVDEHSTLLKSLNRVFETLEVDLALKEAMQAMAETNTTTSTNITGLTKLLRNAKLQELMTHLNAFQTSINSLRS
ncbi:hypothetical protein Tco_0898355, partial [Tanacetum coccineum]